MYSHYKESDRDPLEQELLKLKKPQLSSDLKEDVKKQLFQNIQMKEQTERLPLSLRRLARAVQQKGRQVSMPGWASVMLKERLLDYIEVSDSWKRQEMPETSGNMLQTALATVLLFVFATTAVFFLPFKANVVHAKATYIDDVSGEVLIVRKTEMIEAKPMMELEEGDKILTDEESKVTIHFFDDSIMRLGEKSGLQVNRLYAEPLSPAQTHVEVYMEEGRMWTRVVNLSDESSFHVDTDSLSADVKKKAAFDLQTNDEMTEVAVYENVVELTSNKDKNQSGKTVISGYKAEVSDEMVAIEKIEKLPDDDENTVWVAVNLSSDEEYEEGLALDTEELIEGAGDALLASSFTVSDEDIEKARMDIDDAYKTLVNAEAQLVRGARNEGTEGLRDFKQKIAVIIGSLPALEEKDPLYAEILREMMQEKIDVQLKDFASFRPGDRLYRAKEALQETELALAATDVQKVQVQLEQAEDALLEMQELLADGDPHLAATLLKRFQKRTNNFSLTLSEENADEMDDKFVSLIERQADHMKVLTSIEQSIVYRDQFEFRDEVRSVREDTLRRFIIALEQNPDQVPGDVLLEVKHLYDSYVEESSTESDLIDPAVNKLLANEYQVSFLSPANEKVNEPGVIVLVSEKASAEVQEGNWLLGSHSSDSEEAQD